MSRATNIIDSAYRDALGWGSAGYVPSNPYDTRYPSYAPPAIDRGFNTVPFYLLDRQQETLRGPQIPPNDATLVHVPGFPIIPPNTRTTSNQESTGSNNNFIYLSDSDK